MSVAGRLKEISSSKNGSASVEGPGINVASRSDGGRKPNRAADREFGNVLAWLYGLCVVIVITAKLAWMVTSTIGAAQEPQDQVKSNFVPGASRRLTFRDNKW